VTEILPAVDEIWPDVKDCSLYCGRDLTSCTLDGM
jgi:hypothetical protein